MNAKDKARDLIRKFRFKSILDMTNDEIMGSTIQAKQCALIAVDEMLNSMSIQSTDECQYWEQVKSEIIQL